MKEVRVQLDAEKIMPMQNTDFMPNFMRAEILKGKQNPGLAVLAVLNLVTGVYKLYPVYIPIFCNNPYQAEVHATWVVL